MDELILDPVPQEGTPNNSAEFYIGTVNTWNVASGATILLDGQAQATEKRYKVLQTSRPLQENKRYLIMKQSGTYIIIGEIGMPTYWRRISDLASGAATDDIVQKVNNILAALREQGIIYT